MESVRDIRGWIREKGADKCAARESEEAGVVAGRAAAIMSRRESRIPERLKEAARDVTTARTLLGRRLGSRQGSGRIG